MTMAREGRTSGKTSFGKRTQAEKNFRDKKKSNGSKRDDYTSDARPRRSSSFSSRSEKPFAKKSYGKPSFKKRDEDSGERSFAKPRFGKTSSSRFSKFKDDKDQRPFRKSSFSGKTEDSSPKKRFTHSNDSRSRFQKFDKKREDKPFRKEHGDQTPEESNKKIFSRPIESGNRFSKFKKEERPQFSKSEKRERSTNYGKPFRPREKKKSFDGPKQEHQRKNIDAGIKEDTGLIRLNKFMSNSGVGSRREADEFIKMGLVTVNGETITEMGFKVKITDDVRYEGRRLKAEPLVYVLLNKPKGFITTTDDPEERNTVMDLVASACKERIYPVGRLDRNTTGLLLLTNDGDLADKLTHPSYNVKKIYKVELDRPLTKNDFQKILDGVYFEEGKAQVDDLAMVSDDGKEVGIEIHIGWNRIVRRIFEALGYKVERLDRVVYAGLDKKDLGRGQWRFLKPEEIVRLKHFR